MLKSLRRYRPPRTSHCRLCDVCTEQTDHHCSFLNNCIGRRNYNSFIAFLISAVICAFLAIGTSIAHLVIRIRESRNVGDSFFGDWRNVGTIVVLVITGISVIPVLGLLGYHTRLIWLGRTTIEMVSSGLWSAKLSLLTKRRLS